jgi:hypothetical protein
LNSESFVRNAAGTVFEEFAPGDTAGLTRLLVSMVIISGLAAVTYVVLRHLSAKGHQSQETESQDA